MLFILYFSPMTSILGISSFYHDSAACLVVDGEIVAAAQEERFTRIKHDSNYPQLAIDYVLAEGNMLLSEIEEGTCIGNPSFNRVSSSKLYSIISKVLCSTDIAAAKFIPMLTASP